MANLKNKTTFSVEGIGDVIAETPARFCKRHKGLTPSGFRAARLKGWVDIWRDGNTTLVLLTPKTMTYTPRPNIKRRSTVRRAR